MLVANLMKIMVALMVHKRKLIYFVIGLFILLLGYIIYSFIYAQYKRTHSKSNHVMVASISSNGRYVLTTNANRHAYFWDIKKHQVHPIQQWPINIYSAHFIHGSHRYMFQNDQSNEVYIQNVKGKLVKKFKARFPVYGQTITQDLKHFIASEEKQKMHFDNIETGHGIWYGNPNLGFFGGNKLWQPMLTPKEKYVVATSGYGRFYIWDPKSGKNKKRIVKNNGFTASDISPDGHYVVTGDVQKHSVVYDLEEQKLIHSIGIETPVKPSGKGYFKSPHVQYPKIRSVTGLNFIDNNHYLVSFAASFMHFHYLGLYKINDLKKRHLGHGLGSYPATFPLKYLKLDTKTVTVHKNGKTHKKTIYPETQSFLRSQSFDTAPQANRVVMGQANGGGIMVYQYDPDKQKLKLIWAPQLKEHEGHWWQF